MMRLLWWEICWPAYILVRDGTARGAGSEHYSVVMECDEACLMITRYTLAGSL